jgi:hypothetical protein
MAPRFMQLHTAKMRRKLDSLGPLSTKGQEPCKQRMGATGLGVAKQPDGPTFTSRALS